MADIKVNIIGINELDFTPASGVTATLISPGVVELDIAGSGGGGTPFQETPSGTMNSVNLVFTLSHTPITNTLIVFLNGVEQVVGVDIAVSGVTVTFTVAPEYDDTMKAVYTY